MQSDQHAPHEASNRRKQTTRQGPGVLHGPYQPCPPRGLLVWAPWLPEPGSWALPVVSAVLCVARSHGPGMPGGRSGPPQVAAVAGPRPRAAALRLKPALGLSGRAPLGHCWGGRGTRMHDGVHLHVVRGVHHGSTASVHLWGPLQDRRWCA